MNLDEEVFRRAGAICRMRANAGVSQGRLTIACCLQTGRFRRKASAFKRVADPAETEIVGAAAGLVPCIGSSKQESRRQ